MFSVPRDTEGVEIRRIDTMGGREVNDVFFADAFVGRDRLVGVEGEGWKQLIAGLNFERLVIGAQSSAMRAARVRRHAHLRQGAQAVRQADRQFQALSHRLADLATEVECCRCSCYDVAADASTRTPTRCSRARRRWSKLKVTETAKQVALEGMQMMGGYGYDDRVRHGAPRAHDASSAPLRGHQRDPARHHRQDPRPVGLRSRYPGRCLRCRTRCRRDRPAPPSGSRRACPCRSRWRRGRPDA